MTMKLIGTTTVTSDTQTITLSSIPSTGSDLYVTVSAKYNYASSFTGMNMRINGDSSAVYSRNFIFGDGSSKAASGGSDETSFFLNIGATGTNGTADIFSNGYFYFPNYAGSMAKGFSSDWVVENNTATAYQELFAGSWNSTAAITSLSFYNASTNPVVPFAAGTTISVYTITKGTGV